MNATPPVNSSFSLKLPTLQLAWDSTSLGEFKICPRRYQLSILLGFTPHVQSVHLTWGLLIHQALESYYRLKFQGTNHEDALRAVVHEALRATWNPDLSRPWDSNRPTKNRLTLIRTIVWYLDQFGPNDPLRTMELSDGRPAVELSFRFESSYRSNSTAEPFLICGHMDRVVNLNGNPWISDFKSTEHTLNQSFFDKFTPDNQFTIYTIAGKIFYHKPVNGIILDGCQTAATFSRFDRQLVQRSDWQLQEWFNDLQYWLSQAEECAIAAHWPQNDKSCGLYGGCQFREVCSQPSPESQQSVLKAHFTRRVWDPLVVRGDI